ncbi:kinase-like domain-containing protein [Baffinella frigidus]|nr:kinase-like domain-containing protein [Cryptophyta sp. CCMP2293]
MREEVTRVYTRQLLCGVAHIHECGIVHRDIKPQNLLLAVNGCLKVGDFGEATDVGEGAAADVMLKSMRGTTRYGDRA